MVFYQNLVAVIKVNGKILREIDNVVTLPFKSEYEIMIKNLDNRRVAIKISIDDNDVLDHNKLIISANSEFILRGFMKGNRVTNRFKFIEKTQEIADYRGDKIDDGIIRIEYAFEECEYYVYPHFATTTTGSYISPNTANASNILCSANCSNIQSSYTSNNTDGITVKGSEVNQNFESSSYIQ